MISRRILLWSAPLAFAGCATPSSTSTALAGAVDAAETIVQSFLTEAPLLSVLVPKALPPAVLSLLTNPTTTGYLDLAKADLAQLLKTMNGTALSDAAGASVLDNVENYLNLAVREISPVLSIASALVPGLAQAQAVIQDIVLALPIVEAFVTSTIPAAPVASHGTASARAKALPMAGKPKPSAYAALASLKAHASGDE